MAVANFAGAWAEKRFARSAGDYYSYKRLLRSAWPRFVRASKARLETF